MEKFTCCICGKEVEGFSCNPSPLVEGDVRCCQECNDNYVLPFRSMVIKFMNKIEDDLGVWLNRYPLDGE